jgi:hypothetical protein
VPDVAEGRAVYIYRLRLISSEDARVGIPFHEPLKNIDVIRKCKLIPRCRGTRPNRSAIPRGSEACLFKVVRNMRTKNVSIVTLDTGQDPPIRGGG